MPCNICSSFLSLIPRLLSIWIRRDEFILSLERCALNSSEIAGSFKSNEHRKNDLTRFDGTTCIWYLTHATMNVRGNLEHGIDAKSAA